MKRSVVTFSATIASFVIVLGGFAVTQTPALSPRYATALTAFQQTPTRGPVAFSDTLQMTQPANLGSAPVISSTPPYLVAASATQSVKPSPQLGLSHGQPRVSGTAPVLGQAPALLDAPAVAAATSSLPELALPARPALPALMEPFVCAACDSAVLAFDGVNFAVQTADPVSVTTQRLIAALAAYDVDLRASAIAFPSSEVRYYRAQDADAARILAAQYDANLVDLTWIGSQNETAQIDIILAGSAD